jgi:hypothetical protein
MVDQIFLAPVELALKMGVIFGWVYRRTRQGAVNPLPVVKLCSARFEMESTRG